MPILRAALVIALSLRAAAAPAASAPDPATDAAAAFAEGRQHFEDAAYEAALQRFRSAYRISPHDKVRYNIGQCLARLGRYREAFAEFDAVARSAQLSAEERELARAEAETAASKLGTLRFVGDEGREVAVDGQLGCQVPCTLDVDPGTRTVSVDSGRVLGDWEVASGSVLDVRIEPPTPAPGAPPPVLGREPSDVEPRAMTPRSGAATTRRAKPSALTWVGIPVAVVGAAGILGFGLRARALHAEFQADPSVDTRDRGIRARNLANASIAVAAVGGSLLVADLIRLAVLRRRR